MGPTDRAPQTESQLLQDVPGSNTPGIFPQKSIPPAERILYETRPSIWGMYGGRLTLFLLLAALFVLFGVFNPNVLAGSIILAVIFLIPAIFWILIWRGTAYALTDRRVLFVTGVFQTSFREAQYDQIQNLSLESGWGGGLKFDATPPQAPHTLVGTRKFAKKINWRALKDPVRVQSFVQEAFALHEREAAQSGLRDALIARMTENRFPCAYCRTLIDIRTVDFASPRCPSCGAPLVAPGA